MKPEALILTSLILGAFLIGVFCAGFLTAMRWLAPRASVFADKVMERVRAPAPAAAPVLTASDLEEDDDRPSGGRHWREFKTWRQTSGLEDDDETVQAVEWAYLRLQGIDTDQGSVADAMKILALHRAPIPVEAKAAAASEPREWLEGAHNL